MRLVVVLLLAAAVLSGPAAAATVDPKALVLVEREAPQGYLFDPSNSVVVPRTWAMGSRDARARELARAGFVGAYIARYLNSGPPRWRYVTSGAYVFRGATGAKRALTSTLLPESAGLAVARRVRLGDEAWLRTSARRDPGTVVTWRHGRVVGFVVCTEMVDHEALALALARKQQRRIAAELG